MGKQTTLRVRELRYTSVAMDIASLLKNLANAYMAATLAKRVTADLLKSAPYQAITAAMLAGALVGVLARRRPRRRSEFDSAGA